MDRYKFCAAIGTVIMGFSSFAACLASGIWVTLGNVGLIISIIIMSYGFSKWQP